MKLRGSAVSLLLLAAAQSTAVAQSAAASRPASVQLAVLGDPTPVTLKLDKISPKDAFDKLEAASHIKMVLAQPDLLTRLDDHPITADFQNEPYLGAVLTMCSQAGVQVNFIGSRLMLLPSPDHRSIPPHTAAGPLAIFCNSSVVSRELHYGASPTRTASAVLNFSIISEPRIPVVGIDGPPTEVHAIDAHGNVVGALESPVASMRLPVEMMSENRFFSLQLALGPDAGDVLKSVGGTIFVRAITQTDSLKINDIAGAEGTVTKLGDSEFTITHVEQQAVGHCVVTIDVRSGSLTPTFFTRLRFADPQFAPRLDGQAGSVQFRNVQNNGDVQTLTLQIDRPPGLEAADPKPFNLLWPLPSEIRRVEVPFVFHDLKIR